MENQVPNVSVSSADNETEQFIQATVLPALQSLQSQLGNYGRAGTISRDDNSVAVEITHNGQPEAEYRVRVNNRIASPTLTTTNDQGEHESVGGYFRHSLSEYTIDDLPQQEIINWFLEQDKYGLNQS